MYKNPGNVRYRRIIKLIQTDDLHNEAKRGWVLLNRKFKRKLERYLKKKFPLKLEKALIDKTTDITLRETYRMIQNDKYPKDEKLIDYIYRRGRDFMLYYLDIQPSTKE